VGEYERERDRRGRERPAETRPRLLAKPIALGLHLWYVVARLAAGGQT
jgi:hypothetical protein